MLNAENSNLKKLAIFREKIDVAARKQEQEAIFKIWNNQRALENLNVVAKILAREPLPYEISMEAQCKIHYNGISLA